MANKEHLMILKDGVDAWNRWRADNIGILPDLSGVDLVNESLTRADLTMTDLKGARLWIVNLVEANLFKADLTGADLSGAILVGANLSYANLSNATLDGAELVDTNFGYANLNEASFISAIVGGTIFVSNDLSQVAGLETVVHCGPSSIGVDTIYMSKGEILEDFLIGVGLSNDFVNYLLSVEIKPLDFYKCFISFTESDNEFAERLYNDLKAFGVKCWRWKEDAKWGRTLMRSIDEAVNAYDKVVVICSEKSLMAPAVLREIERALQKEDELERRSEVDEVLFPVRLDDYIFTGWHHHRKSDVVAKNVGDFRNWKDSKVYRLNLERLLRDLKAQ